MFGCGLWVQPHGKRQGKLTNHACKRIFLGYLPATMKNILWYNVKTHRIKISYHTLFDKGMNDLPHSQIPPNIQHLQRVRNGQSLPPGPSEVSVPVFGFTKNNPFGTEASKTFTSPVPIPLLDSNFELTLTPIASTYPPTNLDPAPNPSAAHHVPLIKS
jgi:hypothetical protein